jgi:hypothetical protein
LATAPSRRQESTCTAGQRTRRAGTWRCSAGAVWLAECTSQAARTRRRRYSPSPRATELAQVAVRTVQRWSPRGGVSRSRSIRGCSCCTAGVLKVERPPMAARGRRPSRPRGAYVDSRKLPLFRMSQF